MGSQDCPKCVDYICANSSLLSGRSWRLGKIGANQRIVYHWATGDKKVVSVCGAEMAANFDRKANKV